MERFWNWLTQANARKLFTMALAALILTTAWWTWREYAPVDVAPLVPSNVQKEKPPAELGLLAFLEEQAFGVRVPDNLFLFSPGPRRETVYIRTRLPTPRPPEPPKPPKPPPPTPPPTPVPPPKVESISLTYRGLFKRTDGQVLALVENSKSKSSSFYKTGARLFGFKISNIQMDHLDITDASNSVMSLKMGESKILEEGKYAR